MDRPTNMTLIRLAADEELSASQRVDLDRDLQRYPEDRALIEAERRLREATGRVMQSPAAPAGLRQRIVASWRREAAARRGRPVRRAPWRVLSGTSGLAAGLIVLVTVAVVAGLLAEWRPEPTSPVASGGALGAAQSRIGRELGWSVHVPDYFSEGFVYMRMDQAVNSPLGPQAERLVYRAQDGAEISLWIRKDQGEPAAGADRIQPGVAYELINARAVAHRANMPLPPPDDAAAGVHGYAWSDGQFSFLLIASDAGEQLAQIVSYKAGMPGGDLQGLYLP